MLRVACSFSALLVTTTLLGAPQTTPDAIVGDVSSNARWFKGAIPSTGSKDLWIAYSFGTNTCNIGDAMLGYQPLPNANHPLTTANIYRLKDGSFEHIGLGWCFHHFCALQASLCATCEPAGGGCPTNLGIGCSDTNSASSEGAQSSTRTRSMVNATTGVFDPAVTDPTNTDPASSRERVRVRQVDLDPALNLGAAYFVECQLIAPSDAASGNGHNNASHRRIAIGADSTTGYALTFVDATTRELPALRAWKAAHPDVRIQDLDVAGDGRFVVADRAWERSPGVWRYEYCVFNLDSDRAAAAFSVALPPSAEIVGTRFSRPQYHSGEPWSNDAWTPLKSGAQFSWTCPQTFAQNPNAAALRWSTMYSFRFDSLSPPAAALRPATLSLFKPGATNTVPFFVRAPQGCIESNGDVNADGMVSAADLSLVLAEWGALASTSDLNCDGLVDAGDLSILLAAWTQ